MEDYITILNKISAQLEDIVLYNKLQADLLQQLLTNKQNAPDKTMEMIATMLSANPILNKMGLSKEAFEKMMKSKG